MRVCRGRREMGGGEGRRGGEEGSRGEGEGEGEGRTSQLHTSSTEASTRCSGPSVCSLAPNDRRSPWYLYSPSVGSSPSGDPLLWRLVDMRLDWTATRLPPTPEAGQQVSEGQQVSKGQQVSEGQQENGD